MMRSHFDLRGDRRRLLRCLDALMASIGTREGAHHGISLADSCGLSRSAPDTSETERGTTFEVWSLIGDAGDVIMLPTQIEL